MRYAGNMGAHSTTGAWHLIAVDTYTRFLHSRSSPWNTGSSKAHLLLKPSPRAVDRQQADFGKPIHTDPGYEYLNYSKRRGYGEFVTATNDEMMKKVDSLYLSYENNKHLKNKEHMLATRDIHRN
uniref:Uncharacterized protein n=1 Tax=Timema monikensis TaxID=170555 RepID=A0A7R9EFC8_9NEOP|nr:unnamed protein product [Timema monikensis]